MKPWIKSPSPKRKTKEEWRPISPIEYILMDADYVGKKLLYGGFKEP